MRTADGTALEVEFAGKDGRAYSLLPIAADELHRAADEPQFAAAWQIDCPAVSVNPAPNDGVDALAEFALAKRQ